MPKASDIVYYMFHMQELRSIIQWKTWHTPVHERDESKEPHSLRMCFVYLDMTSRSFAAVIKELHPELLVPVCIFYLVLRGLDTIEDDMTLPLEKKEPLLRNFQDVLDKDGWTFTENGPDEKDRELLVNFNYVIEEFKKLKPAYREIIVDITKKMGNGMADYANNAEHNINGVNTIKDYELYCHYVAGLVGEGCTRLFVESGLANPALLQRPELMESMGQFLQQVNIIRDIREDLEDKRRFWPKEVWSKYVDRFEELCDPANKEKAMQCSSEMVLLALNRADECLFYLAGLKEQSVFNFCAIPQTMAIATLEKCFRNPDLFQKNVKITKGEACRLMMQSTQNLQLVCDAFREFARKIHQRNEPTDPNFLKISIACGKIESFIESIFPSQKPPSAPKKKTELELKEEEDSRLDMVYMLIAVVVTVMVITGAMLAVAWFMGARFDVAWDQLKKGIFSKTGAGTESTRQIVEQYDAARREL